MMAAPGTDARGPLGATGELFRKAIWPAHCAAVKRVLITDGRMRQS
jgi:hypothetical protein